jgi:hypothetical protein
MSERSVRMYWRSMRGRCVLNTNWDAINADSTVHVSAAEWSEDPGSPDTSPRFVGAANITARNVVPHGPPHDPNHGVTYVVTVDWPEPLNIVTDIVLLEDTPIVQHPDLQWVRLPFAMQMQQQSNWCWCAVTVSVSNYYGDSLTQCGFANTHLSRNDCCGAGGPGACNVTSDLPTPLNLAGHLASWTATAPTFGALRPEIDAGRPVTLRIQWAGGGGHFIAVSGYLVGSTTWVEVDDPAWGPSDILLSTLNTAYQGVGSVDETHLTN